MALSDDALWAIIDAVPGCEERGDGGAWLISVIRAVETEARKQDTELIRQMRDALETCDNADGYNGPYQFYNDKAVEEAITAARARLDGKL